MSVRSSMQTALIPRVRDLINDPAGVSQVFSDQQIQDRLDWRRTDIRYLQMTAGPTLQSGGVYFWGDYYVGERGSGYTDWETDWTIQDGSWNTVTPATADELTGHWTFTSPPLPSTGEVPPLFITGKSYDVYGSAADLLDMWIAKYTLAYAFSANGQSFQRQQVVASLSTLRNQYRQMQRPRVIEARRSDLTQRNRSMSRIPLLGENDVLNS